MEGPALGDGFGVNAGIGRMVRRGWVIDGRVVAAILAVLVIYAVVAEITDFHLITLRVPGESRLNHRLEECAVLWTLLISATGWIHVWRKRPWPQAARFWPIVFLPPSVGLVKRGNQIPARAHPRFRVATNDPLNSM